MDSLLPPVKKADLPADGSDPPAISLTVAKPDTQEAPVTDAQIPENMVAASAPKDTTSNPMPSAASPEDVDPSIAPAPASDVPVTPIGSVPSTLATDPANISPGAYPVPVAPDAATPVDQPAVSADTTAPLNIDISKAPAAEDPATAGLLSTQAAPPTSDTPLVPPGGDPEAEAREKERKDRSISKIFFKYAGWGASALSLVGVGVGGIAGGVVGAVVGLVLGLGAAVANTFYYA